MKTLKKIAALAVVAGGLVAAGMNGSADAGHYGGYFAPSYGYNYGYNFYRPTLVTYPRVNLLCDAYGCHYFIDSYGIRRHCYATGFSNRYFYYDGFGAKQFILGY